MNTYFIYLESTRENTHSCHKYHVQSSTYNERVAHLLVEGRWKEFDHVRQTEKESSIQVSVVTQHHEERSKCTVY